MSKKTGKRQVSVDESNGKAQGDSERAEFVSTAKGNSSYMERNWARMQPWAATQRADLHPAPVLTAEAKEVVHRFTLTPAGLREMRKHANRD